MAGPFVTVRQRAPTFASYGSKSQNGLSAIALAFLLSADVPGVNWLLSPELLNDAAPCMAFWIAVWFVPQYAASHTADCPEPPAGTEPKADAFSSAAINLNVTKTQAVCASA